MRTFVVFATLVLNGCGAIPCVDSKFGRRAEPIPGNHTASLAVPGLENANRMFSCERYYDAMCASRGNYWAIREIGTRDHHSPSSISTEIDGIGIFAIDLPLCKNIVEGRPTDLSHLSVKINGDAYYFIRRNGPEYTYKKIGPAGAPQPEVNVNFALLIDGAEVKDLPN
jgi:hypothetical protein